VRLELKPEVGLKLQFVVLNLFILLWLTNSVEQSSSRETNNHSVSDH